MGQQAYQHLSSCGDYEIQTCMNCPLDDCRPTSKQCPLRVDDAKLKKDMYQYIYRMQPVSENKISEFFNIEKTRTTRILRLLRRSAVVKNNKEGLIEIKKKDLSIG